uniref:Ribosomal protein S3 n=1 Tax=Riquetophycus sp. HSY-2014a TaxID=1488470 RepID=A0A0E3DBK0_9FLOR|nr:ribosomal protein S3 [Riquetophycus sp. HSY-2014a]
MAQKIHPISFRLGVVQVWNSTIQFYGKSFNQYYLILHKYLQIQNFLFRLFKKNNLLLDFQELKIKRNKICLNIYYLYLPYVKNFDNYLFFGKISKIINQWYFLPNKIHFYLKSELKSTANLIVIYAQYLLNKNMMHKKVLWNLCKLLQLQLDIEKVCCFKSGLLKIKLKGYKIRLAGRLDGSKNQMAKSIEHTTGALPLTNIKNCVEYKNKELYTKSGVCGLQVWLFYEIKEFE